MPGHEAGKFGGVRQDCAIVARRPHSRIRGAGVMLTPFN